ncbi:MAG: ATP-binding protein [Pseudomonadales bacterium]|jgi:sensor histidine kinase regulating citrate/malate metabolism
MTKLISNSLLGKAVVLSLVISILAGTSVFLLGLKEIFTIEEAEFMAASEDNRPQIIEQFFTKRSNDRSRGFGLSMVHGFVLQSGGHIDVRSAPEVGTSVQIWLSISLAANRQVA